MRIGSLLKNVSRSGAKALEGRGQRSGTKMIKPQVHNHDIPPSLALAPVVSPAVPEEIREPAMEIVEEEQRATPGKLEAWLPLFYIGAITTAEVIFIECYCHWHGAQFLLPYPWDLYSA